MKRWMKEAMGSTVAKETKSRIVFVNERRRVRSKTGREWKGKGDLIMKREDSFDISKIGLDPLVQLRVASRMIRRVAPMKVK
jgi:hypothetical protein